MIILFVITIIIFVLVISLQKDDEKPKNRIKSQKEIEIENHTTEILQKAISTRSKVLLEYISAYNYSGNEYTERMIYPISIHTGAELQEQTPLDEGQWVNDELYLYAYCKLRKEKRHFRIDRIISVKIIN